MEKNQFTKVESGPEILDFKGVLKALEAYLGISEADLTAFFANKFPFNQKNMWSVTRKSGPEVLLRQCTMKSTADFTKFYCRIGVNPGRQLDKTTMQMVPKNLPIMLERAGRQDPRVGSSFLGHGPDREGGGEGRS